MSTPLPLLRTRLRARYRLPAMTSSSSSSTVLGWSRRRPRSASLLSSHSFSTTTTTTLPQHHSWSEQPSIATGKQSYYQRQYQYQYQYQYQRVDYNNYYGTRSCISRHSGGATVTTRNTVVSPSRHIDCSRRWASSMIGSSLSSSLSDETILPLEGDAMSAVATTAAADVGDGYDSGYDSGSDGSSSSSAMIETTTTTTTTTTPKKEKKSKRKRRKEGMARERALDVRFLHFQDYATGNGGGGGNASDNDDDSDDPQERAACLLRDDFDRLACDHDLSNFKWISLLEKQLVLRIRKEREDDLKKAAAAAAAADADPSTTQNNNNNNKHNNRLREYWKMALKASSNPKKVPEELKAHFLSRMVVQSGDGVDNNGDNTNNSNIIDDNTNDTESPVLTDSDRADAVWLARGREVAVRHPLLWRRYSAKERKRKVRIAKNILRDRAADYEREHEREHEHENSSNNSGDDEADDEASAAQAFAASQDPSTSLEFYLDWIRIPALIRTHHTETTEDQKWEDAIAMQQLLKERLPVTSYRKMINLVTSYVECFTTDDDDHNPASGGGYGDGDDDSNNDDDDDDERLVTLPTSPLSAGSANVPLSETNDDDDDDDEPEASSKSKKQKQKQFRVLLTNLRKTLPRGRIHWVAKDVANFFYVTTPDEVDLTVAGRKVHMDADVTPNHQTFDSFEMDLLTQDPVLGYSLTNWNEVREQYVQSFLNLQTLFLQLEKEEEQQQQKAGTTEMQSTGLSPKDSIDQVLDQNDDPSSEESVIQTFDIVTALARLDQKKTTTERVRPREYIPLEAMAMGEYWKNHSPSAGTAPTNDDVVMADLLESKAKTDATSKDRTRDDDKPGSSSAFRVFDNDSFPLVPPVERLVIVDNLPIDINEQRIREAYGRCGAIEGIQIFHSRPDLDPGRRSTDSTKKIRSPSSSSRRQKWSRPRTPLYAMVLYKDAKSAKAAACDPLRIFGMVLDHHLMRSHRASDMTTLYLEDVPYSRHDVSSMEFELSQLLRPADLYLCLDDSGHKHLRKKGGGLKSQPLSYTIKFPSFEAAYWSYWKLSLELQILRESERTPSHARATAPALHWMETPKDAKLYWTRKLNF